MAKGNNKGPSYYEKTFGKTAPAPKPPAGDANEEGGFRNKTNFKKSEDTRGKRSGGDKPDFKRSDRPRSEDGKRDFKEGKPRREYGDKPDFKRSDRPRSEDGKRDFNEGKPRRDYGDKPDFKRSDRPRSEDGKRDFNEGKPRRDYGDKPDFKRSDRPRSEDGKRDFKDGKPRRDYGDKPDFKRSDRPRSEAGKRDFKDGNPRRDYGDKPDFKRSDRPRSEDGKRDFKEGKPRRDYGDKPDFKRSDRPRSEDGKRDFKEEQVDQSFEEQAATPAPEKRLRARKEVQSAEPKDEGTIDADAELTEAREEQMPLNKFVAHSGMCSRRDAAVLIKQGKVRVNGELCVEPGRKIADTDEVQVAGKKIKREKHFMYILLNKPKGFITTTEDERGRRTIMDLVADAGANRLYPVGRLDRNTTGLILLTNDGELSQRLSHPKYNIKKVYHVTLDKPITGEDFEKILAGVELEDGLAPVDALSMLEERNELGIEIHSGKNRIVRRIFEHLGYSVERLDRVLYAGLTKKNLPRGTWRPLTERELVFLKHFKS